MQQPEALYIHIPFCLRKCPYCDFYSMADRPHLMAPYIDALMAELRRASAEVGPLTLRSIYLGGGTPTLLSPDQIAGILETCASCFEVAADAEVTCECNPGTIDLRSLKRLHAAGVNRLSIGVQSLADEDLRFLGRIHSAQEGPEAVQDAREAGFDNVSLDLLYCLPDQTIQSWQANLESALQLEPAHVSAYCLQVEPGTPLARRVEQGEISPMADDRQADLYLQTAQLLERAGLAQYEVSNYATPGAECRHNLTYWRNEPYLGLGASAWSFTGGERRQNVADAAAYTDAWMSGEPCVAYRERCSGAEAANETLMMGLRTREGVSLSALHAGHGVDLRTLRSAEIDRLCAEGLVALADDRLSPQPAGMPVVGEITAILAVSEEECLSGRRRGVLGEQRRKQPGCGVRRL